MKALHLACLIPAAWFATPAVAQVHTFPPTVIASIHDEPWDGLGDTVDTGTFRGLIRKQSYREDRAIHEYDVSTISGMQVGQAILSGRVHVNNSLDTGVRTFDFLVYDANGLAEATDYEITASVVGTGQYHPPTDIYFDYSIDATAAVAALIQGGSSWVGLRVQGTSDPNAPNILSDTLGQLEVTLASSVGTGYCFGDLGSGTTCPCGNDNNGTVPGSGCANGVFASGAQLSGSGVASLSADTVVLATTGLEPSNSGLYFQANNDLSPGAIWGDGLQCAGGQLKRLGVRFADGAGYSDTSGYTLPVSVLAGNITAGDTKYYQCWYRNPNGSPCGSDFNASNGLAITWGV